MSRRCVFVDVETTGLEEHHQITEVAWCDISTDTYGTFVAPHNLYNADPAALTMTGYWDRIAKLPIDDGTELTRFHRILGADGTTTTLVAANPTFDAPKIEALFNRLRYANPQPWHHRKLDISNMAYTLFPEKYPTGELPGLADVCRLLDIPLGAHHTALNDVQVGAACFRALEAIRLARAVDAQQR